MKDLEKIKSEDLGCQVQDANPANFAIEQEVAQLVGATVPAPTEPSADDARELGAQLLVFLRRALLPIRSALRTALAAIYAHLDSRCTDYTPAAYAAYQPLPYDPMRPLTPRTLPNLLTALTAFSDRKITGVPEAADGISLVHLLHNYTSVTSLTDDNSYPCTRSGLISTLKSIFPNVSEIHLGCNSSSVPFGFASGLDTIVFTNLRTTSTVMFLNPSTSFTVTSLQLPVAEKIDCIFAWSGNGWWLGEVPNLTSLNLPKLKEIPTINYRPSSGAAAAFIGARCFVLRELNMPELEVINGHIYGGSCLAALEELHMPKLKKWNVAICHGTYAGNLNNLIDLEVGPVETNINISTWTATNVLADADKTATFLQNFREHIALRLTSNGTGLTLTLHRDVYSAIWDSNGDPVNYGEGDPKTQACIDIDSTLVSKGWGVDKAG